jgi:hypothetical protein
MNYRTLLAIIGCLPIICIDGPYSPQGASRNPRGPIDPRGPIGPQSPDNNLSRETHDDRHDLRKNLYDDDRGDVFDSKKDYREDVREETRN